MSLEDHFGQDSWYEEGYYWRKPNRDGSNGKGDLVYNTCGKVIYDNDRSGWAYKAALYCWILLLAKKRWPDYMVHPMDAKHWFGRIVNRIINKVFKKGLPFRAQKRMSRDPFIALYTVSMVLGEYRRIKSARPPLYLYRPNFWAWRKYLMTGKSIHLKMYRFWNRFSLSKKEYVSRLRELREIAIEKRLEINAE